MTHRSSIGNAASNRTCLGGTIHTYRGIATMHPELWADWLHLRREYVASQHWGTDLDPDWYDDDSATFHILHTDPRNRVLVGVRATLVPDIRQSLSWAMVSDEMRDQATRLLPDDAQDIWDITRLVHRTGVPVTHLADILVHSATVTTDQDAGASGRWVCAMVPRLVQLCQRRNVAIAHLATGLVAPTDAEHTHLCLIDARGLGHQHTAGRGRRRTRPITTTR